jgi:hypothetical protein
MCKRNASHTAAVAVGIAAGANDKMLGHTAMLEANAQRTTRLRNTTARQALNSEYFRGAGVQFRIGNLQGMQERRNGANGMSDIEG